MPEEKKTYPMLPAKSWWGLKKKFEKTIPAKVDQRYLASVLEIDEGSASRNVLPYLSDIGLIDDNGKPTALANKWRFDDSYPEVCEEIRKKVYPQGLRDAFSGKDLDKSQVASWFARDTGAGDSAARRMRGLYILLNEADPSGAPSSKPSTSKKKTKAPKAKEKSGIAGQHKDTKPENEKPLMPAESYLLPIHIDLQIHITPEASADQIDQIFSSMAKHLKSFYKPSSTK